MRSLFIIGTTNREQFHLCLFKNRMRFLPSLIISMLFSIPFLYQMGESACYSGKMGCMAGMLAGLVLVFVTMKFTVFYSKRELGKLKGSFLR